MEQLGEALEAIVAIVAEGFPITWTPEERRELALKQFGMLEDEA